MGHAHGNSAQGVSTGEVVTMKSTLAKITTVCMYCVGDMYHTLADFRSDERE